MAGAVARYAPAGPKPSPVRRKATIVIVTCIFSFIGVWSAYLVVAAVAPPAFKTMSMVMFPMITTAAGGYATTACAAILYILPILAVLVVFSRLLVNDSKHLDTGV